MGISSLAKQTALRAGAIFFVKLIGFLGRIPLYRMLGTEGVGLYQIVYSFFGFVLALCCGGIPTTLALTISRDRQFGYRLSSRLFVLTAVIGLAAAAACFMYASPLARMLGEPKLAFALRCLSPAIGLIPALFLVRGMIQGLEGHGRIAASEMIEQTVRIATMLVMAALWMKYGVPSTVGGAVLGAFTGAYAALFFLALVSKPQLTLPETSFSGRHLKMELQLFYKTTLAITATRLIIPLSDFLDSLIIPHRLQVSGLTVSESVSVFGEVVGIAATIAYVPNVLSVALSYTLSTKIAKDWNERNWSRLAARSERSVQMIWLWGTGSGLFLFLFAEPLSDFIFHAPTAAEAIRWLAVVPLCAGLRELTTTLLWGIQLKRSPMNGLLLGVVISLAANYYLTAIPGYAYVGASAGIVSLEAVAAVWNGLTLRKKQLNMGRIGPLIRESLVMSSIVVGSFWIYREAAATFMSKPLSSLGSMAVTGVCIFAYLFIKSGLIVTVFRK